ncbi:MAG: hypothetical protein KDA84_06675, partial [Planctomycetaceae bacterium]|nr:hypothetical protein [Planctomycetaceae bacterium]
MTKTEMQFSFDQKSILQLLAEIKKNDPNLKVFGSRIHQYQLNPPLPITEVDEFESKYDITFPLDYRVFITEIGNGGAGPYYGLFPFGKYDALREFGRWDDGFLVGRLSTMFPHNEKWNLPESFWERQPDLTPEISIDEYDRLSDVWNKELEASYWNPKIMNGA